jgi:inosose dehydratase
VSGPFSIGNNQKGNIMSKINVGIAPIGWTNDDLPELGGETQYQQILSEAALAGFEGTEIGNKYPKDPKVLKHQLELRGIRIASAWFGTYFTTQPLEQVEKDFIAFRDYMNSLGADHINLCEQGNTIQGMMDVPVFDGKPEFTAEEWDKVTKGLDRLGEIAADTGTIVSYHHHMGTGVQTAAEIDRLMENTDPDKVKLLVDIGHLQFSGEDPVDIVTRYKDRIGHFHLKDIRPDVLQRVKDEKLSFLQAVLAGVFTIPGDGQGDFKTILTPIVESDYEGWFLVEAEQDPAKADPFEYALRARKYIKDTLGV